MNTQSSEEIEGPTDDRECEIAASIEQGGRAPDDELADAQPNIDGVNEVPSTAPAGFNVALRAFAHESDALAMGNAIGDVICEIGRVLDLSALDGVTVAYDYEAALAQLNRGYETTHRLTPTRGHATGVAMSPAVMRDGLVKTHMVFHAPYVELLLSEDHEQLAGPIHLIAHECAHVEATSKFDRAFPGTLLQRQILDVLTNLRWQVIKATWEEYAVCRSCANYGSDPLDGYEETFLNCCATARDRANDLIRAYRLHGEHSRVMFEVYGLYGDLMKFAAYYLGTLDGQGIDGSSRKRANELLAGHWFEPFYRRLHDACGVVFDQYGRWTDQTSFERLGDLSQDLVQDGGVRIERIGDDVRIFVPLTASTMPLGTPAL